MEQENWEDSNGCSFDDSNSKILNPSNNMANNCEKNSKLNIHDDWNEDESEPVQSHQQKSGSNIWNKIKTSNISDFSNNRSNERNEYQSNQRSSNFNYKRGNFQSNNNNWNQNGNRPSRGSLDQRGDNYNSHQNYIADNNYDDGSTYHSPRFNNRNRDSQVHSNFKSSRDRYENGGERDYNHRSSSGSRYGSDFGSRDEGFRRGGPRKNFMNDNEHASYSDRFESDRGRFSRGRGINSRGRYSERNNQGSYDFVPTDFNKLSLNDQNQDHDLHAQEEPRPPPYVPAPLSDDVKDVFSGGISEGIDFDNYKNIKVQVSGGDEKQDFISSFEGCSALSPKILKNVTYYGYRTPTPIQKFTIPIILKQEHDLMACAQTGSGKTAAFLIPCFSNILNDDSSTCDNSIAAPYILVIAPTRELSNQIWFEMRKFVYSTSLKTAAIYGGVSTNYLAKSILHGCDALAATPGKLLDFLQKGYVSLRNVRYLILDEADRMLDMGFIDDIRNIVGSYDMPGTYSRRCYMFSATFPTEIQRLASEILADHYYFITIGVVGGAAGTINQHVLSVLPVEKRDKLIEILEEFPNKKILIFVETKRGADFLTAFLCQKGLNTTSIHGDRYQEQREVALKSFIRGETPVLVATSVAARGLDIPNVEVVVNFDMPNSIEDYVHRIGRTGRLGNKGQSFSFYTPGKDDSIAQSLVSILKNAEQEIPPFLASCDISPHGGTQNFVRSRDTRTLPKRSFNALASNQPEKHDYNEEEIPCLVEVQEEEWD